MSTATLWQNTGNDLAAKLKDVTNPLEIRALCVEVVKDIFSKYPTVDSRKNPLTSVRKAITKAFPSTDTQQSECQYFTNSGKGRVERYEHIALWFLSQQSERWESMPENYKIQTPEINDVITVEATEQVTEEITEQVTEQITPANPAMESFLEAVLPSKKVKPAPAVEEVKPVEDNPAVEEVTPAPVAEEVKPVEDNPAPTSGDDIKIIVNGQEIILDEAIITNLKHLQDKGKNLTEVVRASIASYALCEVKKEVREFEDLTLVATDELINNPKYRTHPNRTDVMIRRAIHAILENNQRYKNDKDNQFAITLSAIQEISGSRPQAIQTFMKEHKNVINSYNNRNGLNAYTNRKTNGRRAKDLRHHLPNDGLDLLTL